MTSLDGDKNTPPDWEGRSNGFFGHRKTLQSPNEALQPEAAPPPPPPPRGRKRPRLSALSGFLSFMLIVAVVTMFAVAWGFQRLNEPGPLTADKVVIVPRAEFLEITAQLEREGVIDNAFLFNAALVIGGNRAKLKEGEYSFKQNATIRDVIDILVSGKQVLHAVTLPEGLTSEQIVERLDESDVLGGEVREMPKEGSLLPETYKVVRGMSRSDLIKKMQDDQRKAVDQIWARRASDLPLRSPYELIILASIVEKETGKADERSRVARVFLNRLQKHMRLQSDPTIVYGLVGGKGSLGHSISRAELDKFSPYNTYLIDGLPPGPIANPGRAALEAVANPSRTQELYFVADGTGGHVFAETLDQHSRNVQRWRQLEKETKDKLAPDLTQPAAAPKAGQRSERDDSQVYGALPDSLDPIAISRFAGSSISMSGTDVARGWRVQADVEAPAAPTQTALANDPGKKTSARAEKPLSSFSLGQSFDQLGISVPEPNGGSSARDALDGPAEPVQASDLASDRMAVPASAFRRLDQKTPAPRLGLNLAAGAQPPGSESNSLSPAPAAKPQNKDHPAIYDVSEGTSLDPLLDTTYDLNHSKTVPSLK